MTPDILQCILQFTPCGLILDAYGVLLLGFSFFLKTADSMIEESGTTWDSEAYVAVASARCDGIFGTLFLFVGFVYQAIGYAGLESKVAVVATFAVLVVFLIVYSAWLRSWLTKKWVSDIEAKLRERETQ